jgi:hypothetical protein
MQINEQYCCAACRRPLNDWVESDSCSRPPGSRAGGVGRCGRCGCVYHPECWRLLGQCAGCGSLDEPGYRPLPGDPPLPCPYCDNILLPGRPYCDRCGRECRPDSY